MCKIFKNKSVPFFHNLVYQIFFGLSGCFKYDCPALKGLALEFIALNLYNHDAPCAGHVFAGPTVCRFS